MRRSRRLAPRCLGRTSFPGWSLSVLPACYTLFLKSYGLRAFAAATGVKAQRLRPASPPDIGYWETQIDIKKSRFLVRLARCSTLDEARAFRREVADMRASHNCWAGVAISGIGGSSDDGEPGGTAGVPMRLVLEGGGFFGVVVVVTRYFGGIKLGTGGLVRAYSSACRAIVDIAEWEELVEGTRLRFAHVPVQQTSAFYRFFAEGNRHGAELVGDVSFSGDGAAAATLWVPQTQSEALRAELLSLARTEVEVTEILEGYESADEVEGKDDEENEATQEDEGGEDAECEEYVREQKGLEMHELRELEEKEELSDLEQQEELSDMEEEEVNRVLHDAATQSDRRQEAVAQEPASIQATTPLPLRDPIVRQDIQKLADLQNAENFELPLHGRGNLRDSYDRSGVPKSSEGGLHSRPDDVVVTLPVQQPPPKQSGLKGKLSRPNSHKQ